MAFSDVIIRPNRNNQLKKQNIIMSIEIIRLFIIFLNVLLHIVYSIRKIGDIEINKIKLIIRILI